MLKMSLVLLPLLLGAVVLLGIAWPRYFVPSATVHDADFVAQAIVLKCDFLQGEVHARQVLDKAMENLAEERAQWLKTKIRLTMTDAESTFVAEGFLQRGPNHCARLEMRVLTDDVPSRLLVVSDGEILAQERTIADQAPAITCDDLPADLAKEAYLAGKGCGGPLPLLRQLSPHLKNLKLHTGLLCGQGVLRLKGELPAQSTPCIVPTTIPLQFCYLYLDAKTLWPHRIAWCGTDKANCQRCIVQIDFHDFTLNQELSYEECEGLFSYQP